jgi:hypothetical protein
MPRVACSLLPRKPWLSAVEKGMPRISGLASSLLPRNPWPSTAGTGATQQSADFKAEVSPSSRDARLGASGTFISDAFADVASDPSLPLTSKIFFPALTGGLDGSFMASPEILLPWTLVQVQLPVAESDRSSRTPEIHFKVESSGLPPFQNVDAEKNSDFTNSENSGESPDDDIREQK